jgi:hypothetical protein
MAASLLLGQTVEPPVSPTPSPAAKVFVYDNGKLVPYNEGRTVGQPPADNHRPIRSRIHNLFGKRNNSTNSSSGPVNSFPTETAPPPTIAPGPTSIKVNSSPAPLKPAITAPPTAPTSAPVTDFPRKMPTSFNGPAPAGDVATAPSADTVSPIAMKTLPVAIKSPILAANANRIGRDEKFEWVTGQIEIEKGQYILYYATPETVDPHHGRIALNPQKVDMRAFHNGDLVSVRGQLLTSHGNPVYQLTSADLIEKAKR